MLARLREQLAAGSRRPSAGVVKTAWKGVDERLPGGGLARGAVHEWFPAAEEQEDRRRGWRPPLGLLIHLARRAHAAADGARVVWIGSMVWPYPAALGGGGSSLLSRCLFVRARTAAERLSAAVLVLRSPAVAAVVADGSGFDLTASRRLQLAAEAGSALCLAARPWWEGDCLSAAQTRWRVRPAPSSARAQRWIVELLRCKGVQPIFSEAPPFWSLERDHATRDVGMAADMGDGSRSASAAAGRQCAG